MSVTSTRMTCPHCGVIVSMHGNGRVEVQGDPEHPSNYGRLCSKGAVPGEICQAETNCGSCKPEINELIRQCSGDGVSG